MEKSLTECMSAIAGTDMEIFEDVIEHKYRKFLKFFAIVKDYLKDVKELKYEFTDPDSLSIEISFSKNITLDAKKDLIDEIKASGYDVEKSKIKDKKIKLKITHKE